MKDRTGDIEVQKDNVFERLTAEFAALNAKFRIVSTAHLEECRDAIEKLRDDKVVSESFYAEYLDSFEFKKPGALPNACSIIVIATPQPSSVIDVTFKGQRVRAIIPPTYLYKEIREACTKILFDTLSAAGSGMARARLPMKLLATGSGLGRYGRNDICYVDGMGSFHRLEAFYTDYEFGIDAWQEVSMMGSCTGCSFCLESCPTGCIPGERILVDVERCLTYLNENEKDIPAWVNPRWHNALVGCMRCQIVCPENRDFIRDRDKVEQFTEEETGLILNGVPAKELPAELSAKLGRMGIEELFPLLARNLAALLKLSDKDRT